MRRATTILAIATLTASPVAGQLNSMPVFVSPKGGTGFTLALDYGRGLNTESGKNTAFAGRAILGVGPVSVGAGVGTVNPQLGALRETELQYMGTAALRVFGSGLVPVAVNVFGGAGYLTSGSGTSEIKTLNVPVGVGLGLNIPTPGFSFEPWVAPRLSLRRVEQSGVSDWQSGFGLSAGVGFGFANGLGIHVAGDWSDVSTASILFSPNPLAAEKPAVIGVGLNYTFRLPGVGVPGL